MTTTAEKKAVQRIIRRDLFAVKVYEDCGDEAGWVYQRIFRTRPQAVEYKKGVQADLHRHYPLMDPKIVHPSQRIVDIYLLAGNQIID